MENTPENEVNKENSIGKEKKPLSKKAVIRIVSISLAVVIAVLAIVLPITLTRCGNQSSAIKVTTGGGLGIAGVAVTVYDGKETYATGVTDENGVFDAKLGGKEYRVVLGNLPDGFRPESAYTVKGGNGDVVIAVNSEIVKGEIPEGKTFKPGDVMYDFAVENAFKYTEGASSLSPEKVTLSALAEGKKCIILNFFFTSCRPCKAEIPSMIEALNERSEQNDVLILGISNYAQDNDALVAAFVSELKAPYYMGMDSSNIIARFPKVNAYPTTIVIDRYGVIAMRHTNSETAVSFWRNLMSTYTSDDYTTVPTNPDDDDSFVADMPADFGVEFTKNPQEISDRVNKTGVNVTFSADASPAAWPWKLADDGQSIMPTNAGHMRTPAIIYAELNVPEDMAVTFEYKLSGVEETDFFYVAVDGKRGQGHQTVMDTGVSGWKEGYAFVALEAGRHDIAFTYYKGSDAESAKGTDDAVYVKNIRLENVDSLVAKGFVSDMPYFAARSKNSKGGYDIYERVSLNPEDGFYYLDNQLSSAGDRAMLYCDLAHSTPFFTTATASIYSEYIAQNKCVFGGRDYTTLLNSFNSWASNSEVSNLVPVTRDLQRALDAIYKSVVPATAPYYSENGWLEFCAFYRHFGPGESLGNPIEGLAYFTAFKAHETTGMADDGNLNSYEFKKVIMPRGILFEFVPEKSGVYNLKGVGKIGSDAAIYDDNLRTLGVSHLYANPVNLFGPDSFRRNLGADYDYANVTFDMHHYMQAGKTYYIEVAFSVVEQLGTLKFRIDYMDTQRYEYLTVATSGLYSIDASNHLVLPVYIDVRFDAASGLYVDSVLGKPIYCDFTDNSRMFNLYTIGKLIGKQGDKLKDKNKNDIDPFDFTTYGVASVDIFGTTYECKDYTADMQRYYDEAVKNTGELYGMHAVDKTIHDAIMLFYYFNSDDFGQETEWLQACYFYDYTDATKPSPNAVLKRG